VTALEPTNSGWRIVATKELADHATSIRFVILVSVVALAGLAAIHSASSNIRDAASQASGTPSLFLYLFTVSPDRVPAFYEFIGFLGPLLGIALGFDAISSERSQRTLPRLVSQPIHRDDVINGKFVAGVAAIALAVGTVLAAWRATASCASGWSRPAPTSPASSSSSSCRSSTSRCGSRWPSCSRP
jgi:ABC-2 type transport system permease protein